mgnify:CR=1 FL=1
MKKVGDFWVPDIDLRRWARWGKMRRKTLEYYGEGSGAKTDDIRAALSRFEGGRVALDGGAHVGAYTRIMLERSSPRSITVRSRSRSSGLVR